METILAFILGILTILAPSDAVAQSAPRDGHYGANAVTDVKAARSLKREAVPHYHDCPMQGIQGGTRGSYSERALDDQEGGCSCPRRTR